ncbi:MAG: phosphoribosylanthranilate isomerase [Lachnospiraceae bacterium]|nr:phosphoribosylanthranilate isomerase [Lachnospiraceae bacterium]
MEESGLTAECKIKICGLKRPEDIELVNRLLPDFAGFVFAGTKRKISAEMAAELKRKLRPEILAVGVFVNEPEESVERLAGSGCIDLIQLHGDETADYAARVRQHTGKPVIRAVRVRTPEDIVRAADFPSDYLLFDTYRAGEYGGSGESFGWDMLALAGELLAREGRQLPPYFLAGGLTPENAAEAAQAGGPGNTPFALDVSSGVETAGFKDMEKAAAFIRAMRAHK